ncbi:hypothetical protein [Bdellovibrio sp. HCB337]|uniref:hypothetical protein n=1 Tax=Bdellovibrio sp. HCB337 TaxID=3394358 RepID=UPI0039A4A3FB
MRVTVHLLVSLLLSIFLISCQADKNWPSIDESGDETVTPLPPEPEDENKNGQTDDGTTSEPVTPPVPVVRTQKLLLNQAMVLRYEKNGVLESKVELPVGTQIEIPDDYEVKHLDFRSSNGEIERSSTGFIYGVKLISVAVEYKDQFSAKSMAEINDTDGGLYIFASIVGNLAGTEGSFAIVTPSSLGSGFAKYYSADGKPKNKYTSSINKRFSARLNKGVATDSISASARAKWTSIYQELRKAANRTVQTPKSYLMMEKTEANKWSINYEKTGLISASGAWTIATQATAVRHGFANVPCAEFQSELLRQAYQRAGYRVTDDFNKAKGNPLIWSHTAAVKNFSMALYQAGWVPWDASVYKPPMGAFLMNESGLTPGHTYIAASEDGTIIVDNGAPQGRDLRKTTEKTISIMYMTGVFFLPPGVNPVKW